MYQLVMNYQGGSTGIPFKVRGISNGNSLWPFPTLKVMQFNLEPFQVQPRHDMQFYEKMFIYIRCMHATGWLFVEYSIDAAKVLDLA